MSAADFTLMCIQSIRPSANIREKFQICCQIVREPVMVLAFYIPVDALVLVLIFMVLWRFSELL
jgi:hypothetical protein